MSNTTNNLKLSTLVKKITKKEILEAVRDIRDADISLGWRLSTFVAYLNFKNEIELDYDFVGQAQSETLYSRNYIVFLDLSDYMSEPEWTQKSAVDNIYDRLIDFKNSINDTIKQSNTLLSMLDIDIIAQYMDDDIRESLHSRLSPCSDTIFLQAYLHNDDSLLQYFDM